MFEDLEGVLKLVRDQGEELIVTALILVGRDENPKEPIGADVTDERKQAPVQMAEGAISELDIDDTVRTLDRVDQRTEGG